MCVICSALNFVADKFAITMLRLLFAAILLVHGLIHLMGFAKAFKFAEINQLSLPISRPVGSFWLLAALLFVLSTVLFFLKKEAWWMVALPAVLLSQILIFQFWTDAKFGSIANMVILLGSVLAWSAWNFNTLLEKERQSFLSLQKPSADTVLQQDMLSGLPPIVQTWLERSNSIGKTRTHVVRLRQTGRMRTSPEGSWMPFEARQLIRVAEPGFLWTVAVEAAPFFQLVGRDKYQDGKGYMLIKALALIPVADAKGPQIDQGALLRYLGELVWHPGSALADCIHWEALDDSLAARATMRYGGVEASGVFRFTPDGDPVGFEALRYYDRKEGATLEKWRVRVDPESFREFEDVRIPVRSTVSWQLESGAFDWLQLEIRELTFRDGT
jgi:hypothetical protein